MLTDLYWLAVDFADDARATEAASTDPAVSVLARVAAEARAQAFRESAARIRAVLRRDQDASAVPPQAGTRENGCACRYGPPKATPGQPAAPASPRPETACHCTAPEAVSRKSKPSGIVPLAEGGTIAHRGRYGPPGDILA
jgi:hypothetical protein